MVDKSSYLAYSKECSPTMKIWVRVLLKLTVFSLKFVFENEESKQKRPGLADLKSRERESMGMELFTKRKWRHTSEQIWAWSFCTISILLHFISSSPLGPIQAFIFFYYRAPWYVWESKGMSEEKRVGERERANKMENTIFWTHGQSNSIKKNFHLLIIVVVVKILPPEKIFSTFFSRKKPFYNRLIFVVCGDQRPKDQVIITWVQCDQSWRFFALWATF